MRRSGQVKVPRSVDGIGQDISYAARGLARSRGFTRTAVATLAIGIGINAAVFTVTDAVLFKGFPMVPRNDRLLEVLLIADVLT